MGDSAWAVGDSEGGGLDERSAFARVISHTGISTYLGDGVGDTVVGHGGGLWAVCGEVGDDLGDIGDSTVAGGIDRGTSDERGGSDGETHV